MIYRNAIVLVTLAVSTNAFWFGSEQKIEPQPTVKNVPLGYFRAFTYQPIAFNPQTPNQFYPYPGGKMLQPNPVFTYPKTVPPSSVYGQAPPQNMVQPPPNTPTSQSAVPTQATQPQTAANSPSASPATSTTGTQSQPTLNDIQPPTSVPAQFSSNPHVSTPIRQTPFLPEPVNLQYTITNVAPVPLQQVQFVPCMCPVAVSVSTGINTGMNPELIANKRSDDIPITADYRDPSIVEQSLSEER
ncbi:proline-rich receptor-like protein kinase PERK8 [Bradysia coprophila]|uniref:proline-rich receptor-like protein kinase PERK8 n=1 Tax=Bradysia coprophila TaxID=38358 RepID=UPI00187DAB3E|nr:proline-rich receptor-like protein kinase PERK8 [Bradysia coprophila]